ncbi:MAG: hypothetical protein ACOCSE_00230 [Chitinivibrionales bacterium]
MRKTKKRLLPVCIVLPLVCFCLNPGVSDTTDSDTTDENSGTLSTDSIADNTGAEYEEINTLYAEAEIYEYSSCTNVLTTTKGIYYYKAPDKTRLDIMKTNNGDTSWTTYNPYSSTSCGSDLSTAILHKPIISPKTYSTWNKENSTLSYGTSGDPEIDVSYSDSTTWTYTVDKESWLVTGLTVKEEYVPGYLLERYNANYVYDTSEAAPVLTEVYFDNTTDFSRGGYDFYNIEINSDIPDSVFRES